MVNLVITAKEVKGHCSAGIRAGDRVVLRGANIALDESDKVCGFAFASLYPVIMAARLGHDLKDLGLSERLVQCIDPGPPHSAGGTVLFEIKALTET
ncbi:putative repeat protein (TIGR04076 family) [Hydrogenispora ethanolica]|uniref:Putative repeat protein (TIGR04076 family) n=1 Tax=Hydrogenispora ethanolica TaxID=1082276 RepID=A0A4R1R302_HYDET|nr:TIGR04076 family protein [Hydrogenispora ethanolica]TCL59771.1 putative repeat protein (TIGR04076 family) [Hydrogenispora ethanolica]